MATLPSSTMAKSIHLLQSSLIDTPSCSFHRLLAAASVLSQPDYTDIIEERSISHLCGYPTCSNPVPSSSSPHGPRFRIALKEHRVYDLEETYKYCSSDCMIASRTLLERLPDERVRELVSSKVETVLRLFGIGGEADLGENGDLGISGLMIREKRDPQTPEVSFDQWVGPSDAIDGYVPKQGSKFSTNTKPTQKVDHCGDYAMDFMSTIAIGDGVNAADVDISEQIAKQLEDVVISEKKPRKKKVTSSASKLKPKSAESLQSTARRRVDFKNRVVTGDHVTASSDTSSFSESVVQLEKKKLQKKASHKESKDTGQSGKKREFKEASLKSSLKTSGSTKLGNSVTWADERANETLEEKMGGLHVTDSLEVSHKEEEGGDPLRLASAEACAAALIQAAEAVALGEAEAGEAVSDAGILILPRQQDDRNGDSEVDEDMFESDRGSVKWPMKPVLLDTDMFDMEDSWHDTPPEGFNLSLSTFATMWMSLFGWVTCSSLAYIYGHDESSHEEFLVVNGREYPRKIIMQDGKSSEIRQTLDGCISRALPGLVMDLRLRTPVSSLEKAVGHLLDTMTFVDAVPSFRTRQWHVIVLLFIDALSVHRLPDLAPYVTNREMLLHKVLNVAQISGEEYESMRDLLMPLGRLPQFSMQCGG